MSDTTITAYTRALQQASQMYPPPPLTPSVATGIKTGADNLPTLAGNTGDFYPTISSTLNTTNPGAVPWAQTRPTLTGGIAGGRMSGVCHSTWRQRDTRGHQADYDAFWKQVLLLRLPVLRMIPPS